MLWQSKCFCDFTKIYIDLTRISQDAWSEACSRTTEHEGRDVEQLGEVGHQPPLLQHMWPCHICREETEGSREEAHSGWEHGQDAKAFKVLLLPTTRVSM